MVRKRITTRWLAACLLLALLGGAVAGGAAAKGRHHRHAGGTGGTSADPSVGKPAPSGVGATAGTITFTPASVVYGQDTVATGALASSDAGQPVTLEIELKPGVWNAVASATVGAGGAFSITWRASIVGVYTMRVVSGAYAASAQSVSTPEAPLTIIRSVIATWYGPGLYGNRTACGERLTRHILGVADRTLPCGTPVTLFYEGQTLTVPVIDRGPYANGATFDLTYATAQALGILETVNVGYTVTRGERIAPTNWYPAGSTGASGTTAGTTGTSGPSGTSAGAGSQDGGAVAP